MYVGHRTEVAETCTVSCAAFPDVRFVGLIEPRRNFEGNTVDKHCAEVFFVRCGVNHNECLVSVRETFQVVEVRSGQDRPLAEFHIETVVAEDFGVLSLQANEQRVSECVVIRNEQSRRGHRGGVAVVVGVVNHLIFYVTDDVENFKVSVRSREVNVAVELVALFFGTTSRHRRQVVFREEQLFRAFERAVFRVHTETVEREFALSIRTGESACKHTESENFTGTTVRFDEAHSVGADRHHLVIFNGLLRNYEAVTPSRRFPNFAVAFLEVGKFRGLHIVAGFVVTHRRTGPVFLLIRIERMHSEYFADEGFFFERLFLIIKHHLDRLLQYVECRQG